MSTTPSELSSLLAGFGQTHILQFADQLTAQEQSALFAQLRQVDFPLLARLHRTLVAESRGDQTAAERARRAQPPGRLERLPRTESERERQQEAKEVGEQLLKSGEVGAILVAGGQGTRLGFSDPKGMFPIGPVSDRTLFQVFFESLLACNRKYGCRIPYYIMTSEATHEPTVAFLEQHAYFGVPAEDVHLFQQGWLPAVDERGAVLLADRHRISSSPDGHGGILKALRNADLLQDMERRGLTALYYHQVDNPTAVFCDPVLLGLHEMHDSEITTKVVAKRSADERMGLLVDVDGKTQIIEYSDLPDEVARQTDDEGHLRLWAGNTAMHVFDRTFLQRMASESFELPYHLAHKAVAHLDEDGNRIEPEQPNAYKFEQFIFDVLPEAERALVVEADRAREFNPVKNAEGDDSPQQSRAALARIYRDWATAAGAGVADGVRLEISPLVALNADDAAEAIAGGTQFTSDTVLSGEV